MCNHRVLKQTTCCCFCFVPLQFHCADIYRSKKKYLVFKSNKYLPCHIPISVYSSSIVIFFVYLLSVKTIFLEINIFMIERCQTSCLLSFLLIMRYKKSMLIMSSQKILSPLKIFTFNASM